MGEGVWLVEFEVLLLFFNVGSITHHSKSHIIGFNNSDFAVKCHSVSVLWSSLTKVTFILNMK